MKKFNLDYKYKNIISDRKMYIIREKLTGTQNVGEFLRRQCCGSGTFYKNKTAIAREKIYLRPEIFKHVLFILIKGKICSINIMISNISKSEINGKQRTAIFLWR